MRIWLLCLMFTNMAGSGSIETDVETYYQVFGKGEPILIINGGPGMNSEGFKTIAQDIANFGYQTIIYDQRGTGKSHMKTINSETITMDLMVEDMEALRKKLKIKKWTLMGQSFGGILATHYAARYPQFINKIIFSSSGGVNMKFRSYLSTRLNGNLTQLQRDSLAYFQRLLDGGDNSLSTINRRAAVLAHAYVFDKKYVPVIAARLPQINYDINRLVINDLDRIQYNYLNKFDDFKQPVLILQGKNDILTVETAQEIKMTFPNSTLVLMDRCGHYGWLDAREVFMNSVENFLKKK